MGYAPRVATRPTGLTVTSCSHEAGIQTRLFSASAPASTAWGTANLAIHVPVNIPVATTFTHAFLCNGATASGNIDIGVYDEAWNRVMSTGSVAQSGTSTLQIVDITDILLGPGRYYLALALSSGTGTTIAFASGTAAHGAGLGYAQQASALPLPATATPARFAQTFLPIFGLSRRATL